MRPKRWHRNLRAILLILCSYPLAAQTTGTFAPTGSLNGIRYEHTATLLNNGTVLIAGGYSVSSFLATAELYNPATGTFTATGSLATSRILHTATMLSNGMVLIVGGYTAAAPVGTAELYNPATGTFSPAGTLKTPRYLHQTTLLSNGMVLVTGGMDISRTYVSSAELYNPATNTFSFTANMNAARYEHTATLLNNGTVLVAGGIGLASAELYNPGTGTFTLTGSMSAPIYGRTATPLDDGTVLLTGGFNNSPSPSAETYNSTTGTFSSVGNMTAARAYIATTRLSNGMVFAAGGMDSSSGTTTSSTDLYNPATRTFSATGNMSIGRYEHTTTLLNTGKVLIAGGRNSTDLLSSAELYQPPGPLIGSLSPIAGPIGTVVTISGTGFGSAQGTSTVTFNGATSVPQSWNDTQVVAAVPPGATSGPVLLTVAGIPSNSSTFTVFPTPHISSLSPTSGQVGSQVTIAGTGFGTTQATSTVKFNGTTATISTWSTTSIVATVPTGATTGNVVVTENGINSNGTAFTVLPKITSLSPASGVVGTSVTINGSNFGASQGTSSLTFNGVTATPTAWNAAAIVAPVPAGTGTGPVIVSVGGSPSNGVTFTNTSAPIIASIAPALGKAGTSITITGSLFGATKGASTVTFNGQLATPTSWSTGTIVVPAPTGVTSGRIVVTVNGIASNGVPFVAAPTIASLGPTSGAITAPVTITGTNFNIAQGSSTVAFNGTVSTGITSWSATSIVARVPTGATTGPVVVTVGGTASNTQTFTVTSAPVITSLSPTSGGVGGVVTIQGTTFGATQGTSTVKFNGTLATPTGWTASSITVPVPAGATTGSVIVTVSGVASNAVGFTVLPTPNIASLAPATAPVGILTVITGTNFGSTQAASTVAFNGTMATPTSWSATQIVTPVPTGATTGSVFVTVNGVKSNGITFTVKTGPWITNVSPTQGAAGRAITLTGVNFGASQGTNKVTFNGTAATASSWSATSIAVAIPAGSTTGPLVVTVGGVASNSLTFTVLPTPNIASLSPTSGGVSASITVTGTNFGTTQGTSTVTFNGSVAPATSWTATKIILPVPAGATTGPVVVTVNGVSSNSAAFSVLPTPVINQVGPAAGGVGQLVTIAGSNFGATAGASTVKFNGTTGTPTSWTAAQIVLPVPAAATSGNLVILVNGVSSNAVAFTVLPTPSITSLSPTSGNIGASITITGTNFGTSQSTGAVTFNGTTAVPASWTSTQIALPVPTGASTGPVVVSVNGVPSSGVAFTVLAPPTVLSLTPTSGGIGTAVAIAGANFGSSQGTSTVKFNTTAATPIGWAPNGILVPVPAGAISGNVVVTVNGLATNGPSFTVTAAPGISNLSPPSGSAGTVVTIKGSGFGASAGALSFNGKPAIPQSWTSTQIVAPVPAGTTTGNVVVTVNGVSSNGLVFTLGPPVINSLSPTFGPVGTSVTIDGSNFGFSQGTSTVTLNGGLPIPALWGLIGTNISFNVPPGATTGNVVVTVNGVASNAVPFTVTPHIDGFSLTPGPPLGLPGGPAQMGFVINGTNFDPLGHSTVTIGGITAPVLNWSGTTTLTVQVPSGASQGALNVVVTVAGRASNAAPFNVSQPFACTP